MSEMIGRSVPRPVIDIGATARAAFIQKTYSHLLVAIVGFTALEMWIFSSGLAVTITRAMMGGSWLIMIGLFMVGGWIATHFAKSATSKPAQYFGLTGYVVLEAVLFTPLLYIANVKAPGTIASAAYVTLGGFAALTAIVFVTRKDFSFLRGIVIWGFVCALIAGVAGAIFGFALGTWFSVAMVALAGAAVLYDTSNVLHHYPEDRYVGAALDLFASIAIMFWYILRLFLDRR